MAILREMRVHPLKSGRICSVPQAPLDMHGIRYDRRWMVVDEEGRHLNQKDVPGLAQVEVRFDRGHVIFRKDGYTRHEVRQLEHVCRVRRRVTVYKDPCEAWDLGDDAAQWMSQMLGRTVRLMEVPRDGSRLVWYNDHEDSYVGFADRASLTIVSDASLADLNARIAASGRAPVPMDRFRPNLVVGGCEPYEEETWRMIEVGGIRIRLTIPCQRCEITMKDQRTGELVGPEPLRTLSTYRKWVNPFDPKKARKPIFCMNANHLSEGMLAVGMEVKILETGPPPLEHDLVI